MAELSDNVRWLVTNLIDQDQRICVELQRRVCVQLVVAGLVTMIFRV